MESLEKRIEREFEKAEMAVRKADKVGVAASMEELPKVGTGVGPHYSIKEVAAITGFSVSTIRRYVREGRLVSWQPAEKGGGIRIPRSALANHG